MDENKWSLYLKGNEELLWNGKGKSDPLVNATNKTKLMIRWIVCAVIGIGFTAFYLPYAFSHSFPTNNTIISVAVVLALVLVIAYGPIQEWRTLNGKVSYLLTNRRVLAIQDGNVREMAVDAETPCRAERLGNNTYVVYIGEAACSSKSSQARSNALMGIKDDANQMTGMIFYGVSNAEDICRYLKAYSGKKIA
ncbi:hypothetical protein [Hominifimenecus sp. rT4P-3]|uniref:hypothetical protein n=1 Tax=Hominifimenecus sp. rT4P-3 TaxID=3242979 RepID=UPI003DA34FFD